MVYFHVQFDGMVFYRKIGEEYEKKLGILLEEKDIPYVCK